MSTDVFRQIWGLWNSWVSASFALLHDLVSCIMPISACVLSRSWCSASCSHFPWTHGTARLGGYSQKLLTPRPGFRKGVQQCNRHQTRALHHYIHSAPLTPFIHLDSAAFLVCGFVHIDWSFLADTNTVFSFTYLQDERSRNSANLKPAAPCLCTAEIAFHVNRFFTGQP